MTANAGTEGSNTAPCKYQHVTSLITVETIGGARHCRPAPCGPTRRTGRCSPTGAPPPATGSCPPTRTPSLDFLTDCPAHPVDAAVPGRRHRPPPHRGPGSASRGSSPRCGPSTRPAGVARRTGTAGDDRIRWPPRCASCRHMAGPRACSAAATVACWCSPNWPACPYKHLATLTVGDIAFVDGPATIRSARPAHGRRVRATTPLLCGPCAVTRWLRVLDLVVTKTQPPRSSPDSIKDAEPVTEQSPHLCRSTRDTRRRHRAVFRCCRRSISGGTCRSRCSG